ncbi:MAG TPA: LysR family transcriptional regulator [Ilumatobacteraceae bacterium]|nr:LysR family transcriptional regulator [Ilumatobacteraceae bacterium]
MTGLRDLDMRLLVAFDAVATEGTFGRAAERLGYTQSAVSQQIASLERLIGEQVFDRPGGPRPVELTPLGAHLLDHSRALLTQLDRISDDLDQFRTGDAGRLRVGTFQSVSSTVLPSLISTMQRELPNLEVIAVENDYDDVLQAQLAAGELDISFVVGDVATIFDTRHLLNDPFRLLARPGQFPEGPVAISALIDEPLVGQHQNSCQLINEAGLRSGGVEPSYVFRTNDNGTVAAMVRAGMGVAVLPLLCIEPEDPRLSLHPLDPEFAGREISIAWRRGHTLSPAAERFIELAVAVSVDVEARFAALAAPAPRRRSR